MESFFEVATRKSLSRLEIKEGETKVIGLKSFPSGVSGPEVNILSADQSVASCVQSYHLADTTKKSYIDRMHIVDVLHDAKPVESRGAFYFQISGNSPGTTLVNAVSKAGSTPYAPALPVTVTENKKRLTTWPATQFSVLWSNHPADPKNDTIYWKRDPKDPLLGRGLTSGHNPCERKLVGQCMIRFCAALSHSNVSFQGLAGERCGLKGADHKFHWINPYDFERWKGTRNAYVWEAHPPFQPEPMPGIAAMTFMQGRTGVVLFWNYFSVDPKKGSMYGGHIDLWNKDRMGNTFGRSIPAEEHSAFVRCRKIAFWAID